MLNRRSFLKTSAGAIPIAAAMNLLDPTLSLSAKEVSVPAASGSASRLISLPVRLPAIDPAAEPWQQAIRRVGQSNMTEHDPAVMNIDEWADYWHSAKADVVFISVTGILAFYPSKVKFHCHGKYLKGRDFFGECVSAAKKRNMRVVARMSPDLNWGDALEAHPEWAMRDKDGSVQFSGEEPRVFKTCMFSTYMDDYVPAIMREVNSLYDVDCFYTNGWPPLGSLPDCHCGVCSKLPPTGTPSYCAPLLTAYWTCGTDMTPSPGRKSATVSSSQTQAATCAADRTSIASVKSPHGSKLTTRGAPTTMLLSGAAASRAESAMPCSMASLPPTSPPHIPPVRQDGATAQRILPKPGCG